MNFIIKSNYYSVFFQILLFFFISTSCFLGNSFILYAAFFLSIVYSCTVEISELIMFWSGLSIFNYSFYVLDRDATIVISVILLMRLVILRKGVISYYPSVLCAGLILVLLELLGDFTLLNLDVVICLLNLVIFLFVISDEDLIYFNCFEAIISFATAVFFAIVSMLGMYGGIGEFIYLLFNSSGLYRFGIGYANVQGGAMGLPLYSLLLLSISFSYYMIIKPHKKLTKCFLIVINVFVLIFAVLTISRSLYLGLFAILVAIIMGDKKGKEKFLRTFSILIIFLCILMMFLFRDIINKIFELLINRVVSANEIESGSRLGIWIECLKYQIENPISMLLGSGSCRYPYLDSELAAGAHNLIVDINMSWGLIGFFCIIFLVVNYINRIRKQYKIDTMSYIPLYAYTAFGLIALRSNSMRTFSFLIFILLFIKSLAKEKNEIDTENNSLLLVRG